MFRRMLSVSHLSTGFNKNSHVFSVLCSYIVQNVNFALPGNGKESFNPVLDPNAAPDHHQNVTTSKLSQV